MQHYYWTDWYTGWGWMLWFGMIALIFTSFGNWGYTYRTQRKYLELPHGKNAMEILAKRYASGDITRDEFITMRDEILFSFKANSAKKLQEKKPKLESHP